MPGVRDAGKRVRITQDCRDGSPSTGSYGVYEGDFPYSVYLITGLGSSDFRELLYDPFIKWNAKQESPIPEWERGTPQPEPPYWFPSDNPRIKLDDGTTIWGCECWWALIDEEDPPMEVLQDGLKNTLEFIGLLADAIRSEKGPSAGAEIDAAMQETFRPWAGQEEGPKCQGKET